ncbi:phosphate ABC transporter substrate-binding protein [Tumidithrix elongata RA019]|uniref:Phosphate ABC transporter substrate-binding protein n=1 Tax=Tumidithrix elongata BACA0141 TaxID=2716417 RepID=A0AAW9PYR7_9CYAN|nr:phosphate ABC transporter substrate-binding protein [Tumidithrix elongata RA019]
MSQGKETAVLILSLLVTGGLAAGGYWYFQKESKNSVQTTSTETASPTSSPTSSATQAPPSPVSVASLDTSQPNPAILGIDGSTAMVSLVKELRTAYAQVNPNIPSTFGVPDGSPGGSSKGIQNLMNGSVAIAATSRPLKVNEAQAGVQLFPIAKDAVAIVVGANNSFKGSLTFDQVRDIYTGKITNWSQVGGANIPIKAINRASASGTRDLFQDVVLKGQPFAPDSANFITWPQDETTAILRAIGDNGISYATVSQVEKQEIVRIVSIDGAAPTDVAAIKAGKYPITRNLFLAVKKQTSPAVKQFIDLALSPQGQQIVQKLGFIPLQ